MHPTPLFVRDLPDLPTPPFDNQTDVDALFFNTLNPHGDGFHVVVAKTGYVLGARHAGQATLKPCDPPMPLREADAWIDDNPAMGAFAESDLVPYKPRCDVWLWADAHAPGGRSVAQFSAHLIMQGPAAPNGLRDVLINKPLKVHGARHALRRQREWQLTPAEPLTRLPLHWAHAAGGEVHVPLDHPDAGEVPADVRLPEPVMHPASESVLAWQVCEANPNGCGYCPGWYAKWAQLDRVPAPQIELAHAPFTAHAFERALHGPPLPDPVGVLPLGRAWLPRRTLAGTVEQKSHWQPDEIVRLPADFDYGYWNAAPRDQQCTHLSGGEAIRLVNLAPADHPAGALDGAGNHLIDLELPQQALVLLVQLEQDGVPQLAIERLVVDTVLINLHHNRVELTWRIVLPCNPEIRTMRLIHATESAQLARLAQMEAQATQTAPATPATPSTEAR